jgi:hypothetical protein
MTVAAIDRLVHHSIIIEMNGESYRKRSAVARINAGDYDPPNGARTGHHNCRWLRAREHPC